jgi:hypothetical protein
LSGFLLEMAISHSPAPTPKAKNAGSRHGMAPNQ